MKCPKISFKASRIMNEFCHISVLYADQLPDELSLGMLGNKSYREQNALLRDDEVVRGFRLSGQISPRAWYSLARAVMRAENLDEIKPGSGLYAPAEFLLGLLRDGALGYDDVWEKTRDRLEEYKGKFEGLWDPVGQKTVANLSMLTKREWVVDEILVDFVDCLWGGFSWVDTVAFTPFPDKEVQKKFLAHELSELITPSSMVESRLAESGLDVGIAHTVVDMIAYFSVKDSLSNLERKGIRPNPGYYPAVETLYPLFEKYSRDPSAHDDFGTFVNDMVSKLKESEGQLKVHN